VPLLGPRLDQRVRKLDYGVPVGACRLYLESLGWRYTSCKELTRGKGIHLRADELPRGRLVVSLSRHFTAVIDGVIHDIHDYSDEGRRRICGYWTAVMSG
jgi:hypothetical protein